MPLDRLNAAQRNAVLHDDGPLLIVAGAGTGKTTVIAEKIAYLVNQKGVATERILALTFTEKAAAEMEDRAAAEIERGYLDLTISTFHSFGQRLLERHGLDIGIPNHFKLLTESDAWILARRNLHRFSLDYYRPLGNPGKHISELLAHFAKCKDELISPEDYLTYAQSAALDADGDPTSPLAGEPARLSEVANAYHTYAQILLENSALDFADLIYYAVRLLERRPAILLSLRSRYTHILVDEFQDVNWSQYYLVRMLAGDRGNLTVVGDDDQSIYAFRGASVSNILRFKEEYPAAKEVVLNENYRSGQPILDAAYALIQHNNPDRLEAKLGLDKRLRGASGSPGLVERRHFASLSDEAAWVAGQIAHIKEAQPDTPWDEFAILVRANAHAAPFTAALESRGIPYEFLALSGLYRQRIVMDCVNFFAAVAHAPDPTVPALYRLLHLPEAGFTDRDIQQILFGRKKKAISYHEVLARAGELQLSKEGVAAAARVLSWVENGIRAARTERPTAVLYRFLEESGILSRLARDENNGVRESLRQIRHLKQFFDEVKAYETVVADADVPSFLEHYEQRIASGDGVAMSQPSDTPDSVNILTVHAAKGLEFRHVFVVNLVEDRFPSRERSLAIEVPLALVKEQLPEGDSHIEEERRLLYVAMTRAKERLYLVSADNYGGVRKKKPSRFLVEMGYGAPSETQLMAHEPLDRHDPIEDARGDETLYPLPDSFSFSQLRSYQVCPYQYKLSHILHLPTRGSASFSFGNTMHGTLQKFYELVQEMNGAAQVTLFGASEPERAAGPVRVPTIDTLLSLYDDCWIGDWYESARQRDDYYKKGKEILRAFYATHDGQWRVPLTLESGFKITIGGNVLRGKIDRVDQLTDGTLEIIDYKTGESKEKLSGEDKEQLLLYQIVAETLPEYRHIGGVSRLTFYYLNDNITTSFHGEDKELLALKERLAATMEKIRTRNFSPAPSPFVCKRCDFRDICEYRAV